MYELSHKSPSKRLCWPVPLGFPAVQERDVYARRRWRPREQTIGARRRSLAAVGAAATILALLIGLGCSSGVKAQRTALDSNSSNPATSQPSARLAAGSVHHYEYVFPDGSMYVYDMDAGQRLLRRVALPMARGIRGVVASPATHTLYISYGGDGGSNGSGSLLAYDLLAERVLWQRSYDTGIDSMAVDPAGARIYMPTGELDSSGLWNVLDAHDGRVIASIHGGSGAHNTVMSLDGRQVYLGGREHDYLEVADTATNRVIKNIGPLRSGVRPFTINGRQTLAFTTATGFLGFQVSSVTSGRVLYTQAFPGFNWSPASFAPSAPSHGISLSPNERRLWVMDAPNGYVHVFDVSSLPRRPPRLLRNLRLSHAMSGEESPCSYDCARDGWIQHSLDGRFVYVGDSGDVFDGRTFRRVAYLDALHNTRKMLEIDWRGGVPVATSSRQGMGYVR
jgi:DNA-binding beta-propeller fold protein YncE